MGRLCRVQRSASDAGNGVDVVGLKLRCVVETLEEIVLGSSSVAIFVASIQQRKVNSTAYRTKSTIVVGLAIAAVVVHKFGRIS